MSDCYASYGPLRFEVASSASGQARNDIASAYRNDNNGIYRAFTILDIPDSNFHNLLFFDF